MIKTGSAALAKKVLDEVQDSLTPDNKRYLNLLIEDMESNLAIKCACDLYAAGLCDIPPKLMLEIVEWSNEDGRGYYRKSVERALTAMNDEKLSRNIANNLIDIPKEDRHFAQICAGAGEWAQAAIELMVIAMHRGLVVNSDLVKETLSSWGYDEMGALADDFAKTWLGAPDAKKWARPRCS